MWVAVLGIITIIVSFLGLYGEKRQNKIILIIFNSFFFFIVTLFLITSIAIYELGIELGTYKNLSEASLNETCYNDFWFSPDL